MFVDRLINLDGTLSRVVQSGAVDDYNNPTDTVTTATVKCWYEQVQASENTADTDQQTETHRIYFRSDADVSGLDRLVVNGFTFQILGPPWEVLHPRTQAVTHIEAKGRQVV